jgi:hypothetical protein
MAVNGLMADAKSYPPMIDTAPDSSAEAMIGDLTSGKIDAGILWGPMAGYYAEGKPAAPRHAACQNDGTPARLSYRYGRPAG